MPQISEIIRRMGRNTTTFLLGGGCLISSCFGSGDYTNDISLYTKNNMTFSVSDQTDIMANSSSEKPFIGKNTDVYQQGETAVFRVDSFIFSPPGTPTPQTKTQQTNQPHFQETAYQESQWTEPQLAESQSQLPEPQLPESPPARLSQRLFERIVSDASNMQLSSPQTSSQSSLTAFSTPAYEGSLQTDTSPQNMVSPVQQTQEDQQPVVPFRDMQEITSVTMREQMREQTPVRLSPSSPAQMTAQQMTPVLALRMPDDISKNDANDSNMSVETSGSGDSYITKDQLDAILHDRQPLPQPSGWRKGAYTITPYGFINIDTSYESQRTVNSDYALYSISPDIERHNSFQTDPKTSRLGVKVTGPDIPCTRITTGATLEVDFQGNINYSRNKPGLQLRRGFLEMTYDHSRILIGQEWEIISPLVPQSLNYVPGSCAGNLGYRRAQIRFEHERKFSEDMQTNWQFGICDNVPADFMSDGSIVKANNGWPQFQGRYAVSFGRNPVANNLPVTVGLSGHIGEMDFDYNAVGLRNITHRTWSGNIDIDVPVTTRWRVQGEMFTGENMAASMGGIMQGIDFFTPGLAGVHPRSAQSSGGWGNINCKLTKKFQMNAGYCIEDMKDVLGTAPWQGNYNARDRNQMIFLNGIYNWTDNFLTGLEVSQWQTDWHAYNPATQTTSPMEPGKTTRVDLLVRYSF
ncbi:MAG: hypothetical protein FWC50_09475 [Planctomycetaceae bacterium]|nr:hypothetical protein [Planctomycetaceae bacterium]